MRKRYLSQASRPAVSQRTCLRSQSSYRSFSILHSERQLTDCQFCLYFYQSLRFQTGTIDIGKRILKYMSTCFRSILRVDILRLTRDLFPPLDRPVWKFINWWMI